MELRYYQAEAIDAFFSYFEGGNTGNPLIVIPTGGGKSYIIAELLRRILEMYPNQRIPVLAHRKELIAQNAEELIGLWNKAPIGIYSAGLKKKQLGHNITMAGIQSVYKQGAIIGWSDLIFIDEAHLLAKNSMGQYATFIYEQKKINPNLKIVGFTATPFRLDSGMLTSGEDRIFTDIIYEAPVIDLIERGYLCPPVTRGSDIKADLSNVGKGKDYIGVQLEKAMMYGDLVERTVADIIKHGNEQDRKSWIIFCAGIMHVDSVMNELLRNGISTVSVTGKTSDTERAQNIQDFKDRKVRCIVNCDVLTTGFNAKNIDYLIMLRPTKSAGLYCQMIGRSTRLFPGKEYALVRDYAGNIEEHGPIDKIKIRPRYNREKGEIEDAIETEKVKSCPACGSYLQSFASHCYNCNYTYPLPEVNHSDTASEAGILSTEVSEPRWEFVDFVSYMPHQKRGQKDGPISLKVSYHTDSEDGCIRNIYNEWVCINHEGFARTKAVEWLKTRLTCDIGEINYVAATVTIDEILNDESLLSVPRKVKIRERGKYSEILGYEF